MKKFLFTALLLAAAFGTQAQTKGTNTIGLGFNSQTNKNEYQQGTTNNARSNNYTLGYGRFIGDNVKIGIDIKYGTQINTSSSSSSGIDAKEYGGNVYYQKYYGLLKNFYAFGGGSAAYSNYKNEEYDQTISIAVTGNTYSLSAYGGVAWFICKHIELETNLLSLNVNHSIKQTTPNTLQDKETSTKIDLSSAGSLNGLGFRILFLF